MANQDKEHIEAIVFSSDLSCSYSQSRSNNIRRPRFERLVSYDDMLELTNKLHDLYCSAPAHDDDDNNVNTNNNNKADELSLSSSSCRYEENEDEDEDDDDDCFGGAPATIDDFSKDYYVNNPSSGNSSCIGISPIPLPSPHSEEELPDTVDVNNNCRGWRRRIRLPLLVPWRTNGSCRRRLE
jgi:hypothetical protein